MDIVIGFCLGCLFTCVIVLIIYVTYNERG